MLIEHFKIFHALNINQAPSWNAAAASAADLPTKQADNSFLNTVVMRLSDSLIVFVREPEQSFIFNRTPKHLIEFLIDCHSHFVT